MFLPPSQLESVLLKRIEQLQGLQNAPALGLLHCLASVLQAHTSASGLEWSSTDGQDEGQLDTIQMELSDPALSAQLESWKTWLAADGVVAKAQYLAATHALVKDILSCIIEGSDPAVSRTALDAAWEEDAGLGSEALAAERFKGSLAALATSCSSDGASQTAAACLASLLAKAQEQQRWQGLLEAYATAADQLGQEAMPAVVAAAAEAAADAAAAEAAGSDAPAAAAADGDDSGDLDALLGEDDGDAPDVTPASDRSSEAAKPATAAVEAGDAGDSGAADTAAATAEPAADDNDDTFSLGLSRAASHASVASSEASAAAAGTSGDAAAAAAAGTAAASPAPRRAPPRGLSVKSIEDPELRRALSGTSSADLDELPPDDLDALIQRQGSHAKASTRHARQPAAAGAAGGDGAGGSGEVGKGHLADLDLKAWAEMKDKQQHQLPPAPGMPQRGRTVSGPAVVSGPAAVAQAPLASAGRGDAGKPALDQHLKGARGLAPPGGNPLHSAAFGGGAVRQSIEREAHRGAGAGAAGGVNGVSRHGSNGSNDSPARVRTLAANLSRKLSISEPGPMGQQAEWKHLPALGQGARLHPHEIRQPSYGTLRTAGGSGGMPSRGRGEPVLMEDKLPALPSLTGARGQPPKAMELLRRPSVVQRSDAHHAESATSRAHLPGLGPPSKKSTQGTRALCIQPKKSFRGDSNF